jgi:hypothetical protein
MGFVFADVVVEVLESGTVEFADLFEALLELYEFELGQVVVEVFGYGFAGGFEDGVPVLSIEVAGEGEFVHDEGVLHGIN